MNVWLSICRVPIDLNIESLSYTLRGKTTKRTNGLQICIKIRNKKTLYMHLIRRL